MSLLSSFSDENESLNVAIIGATGGIGRSLVALLVKDPLLKTLYCCSRSSFELDSYQQSLDNIHSVEIDISNDESIKSAAGIIARQGHSLDLIIVATGLLHNDGGLKPEKSLQQLSSENFLNNMTVNALGPALVAKYFIPLMSKNKRTFFGAFSARVGSISDNGLGGWHSYRASKAAVNMLLKNISIEYKLKSPQLIVAGLHPGTVDTDLSKPFQKNVKPEKLFTSEFSAKQILSVINKLSLNDSGYCFAWDGKRIPA
ncbi:MAG: SDR family NAD(P)-dependent oxidoreductase [Cellvibrionaceae bacterium]